MLIIKRKSILYINQNYTIMSNHTEGMDKKSFLTLIAYMAESATDSVIIKHFEDAILRYRKEEAGRADKSKLKTIFTEINVLSYINIVRLIDVNAETIIKEMDDIERIFNLTKPSSS